MENRAPGWWGFTSLYILLCFWTYRDYGITWDETDTYNWGRVYLDYYLRPWTVETLTTTEGATHNYVYPALLRLLWPGGSYDQFHLMSLLFGLLSFGAAYWVFVDIFGKGWRAWMGCFFLLMTPRFMGELPCNPKDAPFAVLFMTALCGIYLVPRKVRGEGLQAFWIGTLIGFTTCVRILGLTLLPVLAIHQTLDRFWGRGPTTAKEALGWFRGRLVFWGLTTFFSQVWVLMLWPYLEKGYLRGMVEILGYSRDFAWDGPILFLGKMIHPSDRIMAYLPVWWLLTTPPFILVFFAWGWFHFLSRGRRTPGSSFFLLLGCALLINLAAYFLLHPIIYNGMRHYLFLVPLVSELAAWGFLGFLSASLPVWVKRVVLALALFDGASTLGQYARLYPYHYLYFNQLAGGLPGAYGKFEIDYLGASLKEAAQWSAANLAPDPARTYRFRTCAGPEQQTYYFKPNMVGSNEMADPDYRIAVNVERDFRLTPEMKDRVVHVVQREGVPLAYVLRMK